MTVILIFLTYHKEWSESSLWERILLLRVLLSFSIHSESFTRKKRTGTGHQPSRVSVVAAYPSNGFQKGKTLSAAALQVPPY